MTNDELIAAIRAVPWPDAVAIATRASSFAGNVVHLSGQWKHDDLVDAHLGVSKAIAATLRPAPGEDLGLRWERLRSAVSTMLAPQGHEVVGGQIPQPPAADRRRFTEDWMAEAVTYADAGRADLAAICAAIADLYDEDDGPGELVR